MHHNKLKKLKREKADYILKNFPNVVGVGVSKKFKNGVETETQSLTVYVSTKVSPQSLNPKDNIKTNSFVLSGLDSADDIDIKQIGVIRKHITPEQTTVRPVHAGTSEGHYLITAGTGGPLVEDKITKKKYRVSNNHVYADENKAKIGDAIYQPGPYDGGRSSSKVGTLERFVPLDITSLNLVDCAIRTVGDTEVPTVFNLNKVPSSIVIPDVGMTVVKMGRTTGVTTGQIIDTDLTISVQYDAGEITFDNQILVYSDTAFSQGGDSGSGVYIDNGQELTWVGLLFAGSDDGNYTICNYAVEVTNALGVQLYVEPVISEPEPPVSDPEPEVPLPEPEPELPAPEPEPEPEPEPPTSDKSNWIIVIGTVIVGIITLIIKLLT